MGTQSADKVCIELLTLEDRNKRKIRLARCRGPGEADLLQLKNVRLRTVKFLKSDGRRPSLSGHPGSGLPGCKGARNFRVWRRRRRSPRRVTISDEAPIPAGRRSVPRSPGARVPQSGASAGLPARSRSGATTGRQRRRRARDRPEIRAARNCVLRVVGARRGGARVSARSDGSRLRRAALAGQIRSRCGAPARQRPKPSRQFMPWNSRP